jgi:2'-5' RNA ligase
MRVFVAMEIPEAVKRAIGEFVRPLTAMRSGARWARVEGMHLTLKFIGEVSPEKVERIKQALSEVKSGAAVELKCRGTGFFPHAKHPRVAWVGIEASANLAEIAAEIETRLEALGIPREQRAFKPHLTLARFKSEEGLAAIREAMEKAREKEFGSCVTREFHLYESKLKREGAEYSKLATFLSAGAS